MEYFFWVSFHISNWNLTIDSGLSRHYFRIPPYPISDAFVSAMKLVFGLIRPKQGIDLTIALMVLTTLVCYYVHGGGFFFNLDRVVYSWPKILYEIRYIIETSQKSLQLDFIKNLIWRVRSKFYRLLNGFNKVRMDFKT